MDRRTVITLGIILAVIIGAFAFLLTSDSAKQAMQKNIEQSVQPTTQPQPQTAPKAETTVAAGKYVNYSQDELAKAEGTRLIFFHAPWCPQCRMLEDDIKKQGVPDGVTILKADYDTNQSLRQQYGVTIQTTVIKVDKTGNLVEKYVAYDEPTLAALVKHLL